MASKKSKGKQKIEMKVVEAYADRMITFTKRKAGIIKKMYKLITKFDVEAGFLVFSESGNPYTFANPSIEELAVRLNNPSTKDPPKKDNIETIVEAHNKKSIEALVKNFEALEKELATVNEKLEGLKKLRNEANLAKMWWNIPLKDLNVEKCHIRHQAFVELHDQLCNMAISQLGKNGGASSSGHEGPGPSGGGKA